MSIFRTLSTKPWIAERGYVSDSHGFNPPTAKVFLSVFLGVVTAIFCLLTAAYFIRMTYADWQTLPVPALLWLNTAILILSSVALQWARTSARDQQVDGIRRGLLAGGALAFAFLVGQFLVWRQLGSLGYFVDTNPSNSFFYLITGLHGLHLLGGLVAWLRASFRLWRGAEVAKIRMSVELCAVYWHFLLLVWLVMFGLLLVT
ncbi:cytochrome c oxidase subunit 3 [Gammaproteobacteria bacterium]|nr:cytochrome c oxidase subunit 3 [Gammaproteobacteria bacterium]MDG2236694.1 cytochrome c oxidase subunit 3 [Arenicellales bacterium]